VLHHELARLVKKICAGCAWSDLIHHPVVEADQRQMGLRNDQVLVISVIRNQRHPALNLQGALTHARQIVAVT